MIYRARQLAEPNARCPTAQIIIVILISAFPRITQVPRMLCAHGIGEDLALSVIVGKPYTRITTYLFRLYQLPDQLALNILPRIFEGVRKWTLCTLHAARFTRV